MTKLRDLPKKELLARLHAHVGSGHVWLAGLVAYLAEVEDRRIHLELACSSMFDFCTRRLKMSEGEAYRRINAARLARRFPSALGYLQRGEVHLCALLALREYLTEENHEELLREASGKTTQAVREMLAARFPRPDVISHLETFDAAPGFELAARVEPLSESRYRVELTISAELKAKLDRVINLMRHRNPKGDLEAILDASVDLLLTKLEKQRLGKVERPRAAPSKTEEEGDASVRRQVFERDGEQCTYVAEDGQRCQELGFLELDHVDPKARRGKSTVPNLRVRCRAHNRLYAEQTFGREHVEKKIHLRQRKSSEPDPMPLERATRGLKHMGFEDREVKRALEIVQAKLDPSTASVETLVREALTALT